MCQIAGICCMCIAVLAGLAPQRETSNEVATAVQLIKQARYDDAIDRLEQVLGTDPGSAEALSYMGTAYLYGSRDISKARKQFAEAFARGGGASFLVVHSHEELSDENLTSYCRGWFHIRKGSVEFTPEEAGHGFRLIPSEITEFKQNRWSKSFFHIRHGEKNYNFRARPGGEDEALLVIALYKRFAR